MLAHQEGKEHPTGGEEMPDIMSIIKSFNNTWFVLCPGHGRCILEGQGKINKPDGGEEGVTEIHTIKRYS